jgi:hypothetical protein
MPVNAANSSWSMANGRCLSICDEIWSNMGMQILFKFGGKYSKFHKKFNNSDVSPPTGYARQLSLVRMWRRNGANCFCP